MRVVIDTDPGIDDALALAVAARSPEIELLAVTTTHGNVDIDLSYRNAVHLLRLFGAPEVPVYRGAAAPLARARGGAEEVHGDHGLGYARPAPPPPDSPAHAVVKLIELAAQARFVLVPVGPLTNVALALALAPETMARGVERIVLMGGNVAAAGNITPVSEFNFWCDPEAAQRVFASGIPIEMVGLDVTRRLLFGPGEIEALGGGKTDGATGELKAMLRFYLEFHRQYEQLDACVINDPLALALLLHPEWGTSVPLHVEIAGGEGPGRGQSIADRRSVPAKPPNCLAYLDIEAAPISAWLRARLSEF